MNKERLIFLDIDNTVYSEQDGISKSTVNAIKQAQDNGHKIIFNTGRIVNDLPEAVLNLKPEGFITSAGAHIEVEGKCILNLSMSMTDLHAICSYLAGNQAVFDLSNNIETFEWNGRMDLYKKEVNKISYHHLPKSARQIMYDLKRYGSIMEPHTDHQGRCTGEIFIKNINKATGIQAVLEYYHADREDTVAFGDEYIDLEMLQYAGIGVAMGNATQKLKQVADMVTKENSKDGIYYGFVACNLL